MQSPYESPNITAMPSMRSLFDVRCYFVVGPDDCVHASLADVVAQAIAGGVSFIQLRAKGADVQDLVRMARVISEQIVMAHAQQRIAFVIDDRVDAVLETRSRGIKVDGVHIGQSDMSPIEARRLLGDDAIIGWSAATLAEVEAAEQLPHGTIDYLGAAPWHATSTKPESGREADGSVRTLSADDVNALCEASSYPIVVGGGVQVSDVPVLAHTQAAGWFVVSAIAGAEHPQAAAQALVDAWLAVRGDTRHGYADATRDPSQLPSALTIAGTDSSGGAGVAADLKTMMANGVFAQCVVAAITAQNTTGVRAVLDVDPDIIREQINAVFDDIRPDAVKIGMVSQVAAIHAIADALTAHHAQHIVLDPVMVATSGAKLIADDAIDALTKRLFPLAEVITPNIPEARALLEHIHAMQHIESSDDMEAAALALAQHFGCNVLLKGGHGTHDANDVLATSNGDLHWFTSERVNNPNTHGTGCTLSSAIAANLAKGMNLVDAIACAKQYLTGALRAMLDLGHGSGPMNHAWQWVRP